MFSYQVPVLGTILGHQLLQFVIFRWPPVTSCTKLGEPVFSWNGAVSFFFFPMFQRQVLVCNPFITGSLFPPTLMLNHWRAQHLKTHLKVWTQKPLAVTQGWSLWTHVKRRDETHDSVETFTNNIIEVPWRRIHGDKNREKKTKAKDKQKGSPNGFLSPLRTIAMPESSRIYGRKTVTSTILFHILDWGETKSHKKRGTWRENREWGWVTRMRRKH